MSLFTETCRLDIRDLNYVFSNKEMAERFLAADPHALPRKGLLPRIFSFGLHLVKNLQVRKWIKMLQMPKHAVIFYAKSDNEYSSLAPVIDKTHAAISVGYQSAYSAALLDFMGRIFSIAFLPQTLLAYHRSRGWEREAFKYAFDQYWLSYGQYICFRLWLRAIKPRLVIQANDHSTENRVLLKAANDERLPTVYLQHGAVFDQFPPLGFDYALLDGTDALEVYEKIGQSSTKVFLIGKPRFDKYAEFIRQSNGITAIGISTNAFDPLDRTAELIGYLRHNFPEIPIILRSHPTDKRMPDWKNLADQEKIDFSIPTVEDVYHFLQRVDVLFSGNSSIHLDAALLNVMPIFYDYTLNEQLMANSFVRKGLCEYAASPQAAADLLRKYMVTRPNVRYRCEDYYATINTVFDGKAASLAVMLLNRLSGHTNEMPIVWERTPETMLEAYQIAKTQNAGEGV